MKFHFLTSIMFAIVYAIQVLVDDKMLRMKLLVPGLVLFYATLILFSVEYDSKGIKEWRRKEKKLIERTFSRFVKMYYDNKPISEILKGKEQAIK